MLASAGDTVVPREGVLGRVRRSCVGGRVREGASRLLSVDGVATAGGG